MSPSEIACETVSKYSNFYRAPKIQLGWLNLPATFWICCSYSRLAKKR